MELEPASGDNYAQIIYYADRLRNENPSVEEIQQLKRENGELQRENENMKITMNSQRLRVIEIMNEGILDTGHREARENFRHGKDTTRKGPKVHSPVRDSQLKEPASTSSSNISDDIVEHDVHSDSMQLTKKHQTPGSFQEEKSILDQHGSDSEGQLYRSSWLTKTDPRESDDDSPGVLETFTPESLELFKETRRRTKDSLRKPQSSDITELPRLRPNPHPTFGNAHRLWTRGPSPKSDT